MLSAPPCSLAQSTRCSHMAARGTSAAAAAARRSQAPRAPGRWGAVPQPVAAHEHQVAGASAAGRHVGGDVAGVGAQPGGDGVAAGQVERHVGGDALGHGLGRDAVVDRELLDRPGASPSGRDDVAGGRGPRWPCAARTGWRRRPRSCRRRGCRRGPVGVGVVGHGAGGGVGVGHRGHEVVGTANGRPPRRATAASTAARDARCGLGLIETPSDTTTPASPRRSRPGRRSPRCGGAAGPGGWRRPACPVDDVTGSSARCPHVVQYPSSPTSPPHLSQTARGGELEARVERRVLVPRLGRWAARRGAVGRRLPHASQNWPPPAPRPARYDCRSSDAGADRGIARDSQQAPRPNPGGVEQLVPAGRVGGGVGQLEQGALGGRPQLGPRSGDPPTDGPTRSPRASAARAAEYSAAASSASSAARGPAADVRTRSPATRAVSSSYGPASIRRQAAVSASARADGGRHRGVDAGGVDRPVELGQRPGQPRDGGHPRGVGDRHLLEQVGGLLERGGPPRRRARPLARGRRRPRPERGVGVGQEPHGTVRAAGGQRRHAVQVRPGVVDDRGELAGLGRRRRRAGR